MFKMFVGLGKSFWTTDFADGKVLGRAVLLHGLEITAARQRLPIESEKRSGNFTLFSIFVFSAISAANSFF